MRSCKHRVAERARVRRVAAQKVRRRRAAEEEEEEACAPNVEPSNGAGKRSDVAVPPPVLACACHHDAAGARQHRAHHEQRPPPPVLRRRTVRVVADRRAEELRDSCAAKHDAEHHGVAVGEEPYRLRRQDHHAERRDHQAVREGKRVEAYEEARRRAGPCLLVLLLEQVGLGRGLARRLMRRALQRGHRRIAHGSPVPPELLHPSGGDSSAAGYSAAEPPRRRGRYTCHLWQPPRHTTVLRVLRETLLASLSFASPFT